MSRLSLGYIDDQIDSLLASNNTTIANMKSTAIGTAPSGYQTLGDIYTAYMTLVTAQNKLATDTNLLIGETAVSSLPADYQTLNAMATRIVALQTQLSQTGANTSYDQLLEISNYLVTYSASYIDKINAKVMEASFRRGSSAFNATDSSTGKTTVTMASAFANANYRVFIEPTDSPGGYLGEFYVTNKTTTTFDVYCTGTAATAFEYIAVLDSGI